MTQQRLLDDVRVIDLSQYIPGPFATRQLADLGAEVIKVEPPGGDPMRRFMHRDPAQPSAVYRHLNRGKRIVELDLKTDAGRAALQTLVTDADILLESYRPGVLARLGFDHDQLDTINPKLIHCALSGYGQTGPYAQRSGHDLNYCALSSQAIASGTPERPVISFPPIADHAAALQAAVAMLAALHARDKQESGIFLDISLTESILAWQYLPLLANASERAASLLNGGAACYNLYRCADGAFISLGAIEAAFWRRFCEAVDRPQWLERQYESMPQGALIAEVANLIESQPLGHWQNILDQADCCFEALFEVSALPLHPQIQARRAFNAAGPTYSGWINQHPVELADDFETIDNSKPIDWIKPA
jgi:crotonobetainyl-CoA:carnitine CoA-transferase CaiB-like acyl-CoA transferase